MNRPLLAGTVLGAALVAGSAVSLGPAEAQGYMAAAASDTGPSFRTRAYVANQFDGTVSVVDTATRKTVATIPTGFNTNTLALSPSGRRLYVTVPTSRDEIVIIDTATNREIGSIAAPGHANGIVISDDGRVAYVSAFNDGTVTAYDLRRRVPIATYNLGLDTGPVGLALARDKLYVVAQVTASVVVLNARSLVEQKVLSVPGATTLRGARAAADGRFVYVSGDGGTILGTIATATDRVVASTRTFGAHHEFGADGLVPVGGSLYSLVSEEERVAIHRTPFLSFEGTMPIKGCLGPNDITSDFSGRQLFLTCHFVDRLMIVKLHGYPRVRSVATGDGPMNVVFGRVPRPRS